MKTTDTPEVVDKGTSSDMQPSPRQPSSLTNLGRMAGAIGVVLLISTPLMALLTTQLSYLVWGKLFVAAGLVAFYLVTNRDFFARVSGSRSSGLLAMTVTISIIVIGLVAVANYFALRNDQQVDLTREGLYTLSKQTKGVLARLDEPVQMLAFFGNVEPEYAEVRETLERYSHESKELTYELVNPQERPDLVETYNITQYGPRIVVVAGEREARAKNSSEMELTNAIVKVAEQTQKTVYFLTGHGEPNLEDGENPEGYKVLADAIVAEGYDVETLSLIKGLEAPEGRDVVSLKEVALKEGGPSEDEAGLEIPADVAVLVIAAPRGMLFEPEIEAIDAYLERGGRVVLLLEPKAESGLDNLLEKWSIEMRDDIVVDSNVMNRLLNLGPAAPMVYPVEGDPHPATKDLSTPAVMFTVRSLAQKPNEERGVEVQPIIETGESAWGETNPVDGAAERDGKDHIGPVTVGMLASRHVPSHEAERLSDNGRLAVFGDSDWLNNQYLPLQGNTDLFINMINWLAEQEEKISIGRKTRASSQIFFAVGELGLLKFISLDILPVLYIALGLGIVLVRRQK